MTQKQIIEEKIVRLTEMLPVAEAADNGKRIQIFQDDQWRYVADPSWSLHNKYRTEPEPREFWITECLCFTRVFLSAESASTHAGSHNIEPAIIHVREVTE